MIRTSFSHLIRVRRTHLVFPAGDGQDAALTIPRIVIHYRAPRFATLKGKALSQLITTDFFKLNVREVYAVAYSIVADRRIDEQRVFVKSETSQTADLGKLNEVFVR